MIIIKRILLFYFIVHVSIVLISCNGQPEAIEDYVDHWEVSTHLRTYGNSQLAIDTVENEYQVQQGENQVVIVTIDRIPIFKENKELTDLHTSSSLLFELNKTDSIVSAGAPLNSGLFRKLIAFSPDYGIKKLNEEEDIKLVRIDATIWEIDSKLRDLDLSAKLDFNSNQELIYRHNDY